MSSETRIVVVRKKGWRDKLRAYAVLIDGRKVGKIREGKTEAFSVEPGAHGGASIGYDPAERLLYGAGEPEEAIDAYESYQAGSGEFTSWYGRGAEPRVRLDFGA